MALVLVATPGASNANSYLTLAEATSYFESRSAIAAWVALTNGQKEALLVMATRTIDALLSGGRVFVSSSEPYFLIRAAWTGEPATETQALAWPRIGMFNRNGVAIAETVIPQELKDATAEMAGQLAMADRTLDFGVAVQGITSVRAGSVAMTFKDGVMVTKVLPDAVLFLLVPSWMTDEEIEWLGGEVDFEVMP